MFADEESGFFGFLDNCVAFAVNAMCCCYDYFSAD